MGSIWCVQPDDDRVDLVWERAPGGPKPFWVRFKKQLNVGEDRQVRTAGLKGIKTDTPGAEGQRADPAVGPRQSEIQIDWRVTGVVRALVWLTDWSLTDDKDRKLRLTRDVIETLHQDVFGLIEDALTVHVEAIEAQKKATPSGTPEPLVKSA